LTSLSAFQAALSAHLEVFLFLSSAHGLGSLATHFTWFLAAFFLAELRYRQADFLNILRLENRAVGPDE